MTHAETIPVKHIFLDVVGFTHKRSVDAQTDIVQTLNMIVRDSVSNLKIDQEHLLFLPTGDGICIALLNIETPFDIHIQLALQILRRLH